MSLLMEAMEYHLLPDRRAGLDPERTRPRSRGNKTQVYMYIYVGCIEPITMYNTPAIEVLVASHT